MKILFGRSVLWESCFQDFYLYVALIEQIDIVQTPLSQSSRLLKITSVFDLFPTPEIEAGDFVGVNNLTAQIFDRDYAKQRRF